MNLLPATVRRRGKATRTATPGSGRSVGGALLVGLTLFVIGLDVHSLKTRLESANSDRDRLRARIAEREGEEERLAAVRERLRRLRVAEDRLARWDEERFVPSELLREFSRAVPGEVVLEEIRREGPELRVTGRTRSAASVASTLDAFSRMGRVGEMELLWVERMSAGDDAEDQRFAVAGALRYASRDPQPFGRIEAVGGNRERPR